MRKLKKPRCIVCDKELKLLPSWDTDEDIKRLKKYYNNIDNPPHLYNVINGDGCVMAAIGGAYGSRYDYTTLAIGICDECIDIKVESKAVLFFDHMHMPDRV